MIEGVEERETVRGPRRPARCAPYSRREFLRLAGSAAVAAAVSACTPSGRLHSPTAVTQAQLVYQDWRTDWFPPMAREMLEQFQGAHRGIRVFFTPDPEEFEGRMLADLQAGTAPDVFQGCCTHMPMWAQEGYLLDLRPYVAADLDAATLEDWDSAQYKALATSDGQQFGLPKYHGALALFFNKDLFDTYGVDYPDGSWDHDDYLQAMVSLTHDQNGDGRTDLWGSLMDLTWDRIQVHVNGWGGHLVDPRNNGQCAMDEPRALGAMEWIRARLWDDRVMATPRDVLKMPPRQAFASGRVAMVEDGSWALKDILARAPFRVGVAPFPAGPVRRVTLASTDGFGIYAGTRHPDAAWELLKFLVSKEYGRAMARANLLQPARASLVEEWAGYVRDEFPEKAADMDIAAFAEGHRKGYSVTAEIAANMVLASRMAKAAWERVFVLGQAPVKEMTATCIQIEAGP